MTEDHRNTLSPQETKGDSTCWRPKAKEYAVFLVEPGGRLICWNPGAERLFGYTPSEADRLRHQESGFDHYFVKPVSLEKLTELFEKVVPVRGTA